MSERDRAAEPISPLRFLGRGLFVDVVLPWITVRLLEQQGVSTVRALAAAALFPAASILVTWRRERRLEVIGIAVLATILLGIGTALVSDDVRFGLLRAAPAFGLFGVAALASLRANRPLMFFVARHFQSAGDPAKAAEWDARSELPAFRHAMQVITLVWGLACLVESILGFGVAFLAPIHVALVAEPAIGIGTVLGLLLWTGAYARARQSASGRNAASA